LFAGVWNFWIPAFAGMTMLLQVHCSSFIIAMAGVRVLQEQYVTRAGVYKLALVSLHAFMVYFRGLYIFVCNETGR
jgi:hypothetical protein